MVTKRWDGRLSAVGRGQESEVPQGGWHGQRALEDICIPEEDSRLHARARVDFGPVQLKGLFWASLAGVFSIRIHVPRALQQQISGNGLVGSVLGSARITSDISERVGSIGPQVSAPDVCLFVGFHEASRGSWMVDLRLLRGGRLQVPVSSSAASVYLRASVELSFDEDLIARAGPISVPSGSVADLWRSIRDEVRALLAQQVASSMPQNLAAGRPAARNSPGGDAVMRVWREPTVALRA